jgi:uncharacterized repeat protein (TIGR03803 family)
MQRKSRSVFSRPWWSSFWRRAWQSSPARRTRSAPLHVRQLETRLTPSLSTLASFNSTDGANPYAGLIMDGSGNLYGTAESGGAANDGTIFELAHGRGTLTTLASFNGTDGANPFAGLVMDGSDNLYGTTYQGGASGNGTVFELAKGSGTITTLASFNGTDGANPAAALITDTSGNLYGTAFNGGASGNGAIFELAHGSGTITTLASFNGTDGQAPYAGLVMDGSGNLYGATVFGGASGDGTVFELAHGTGTITSLASFNGSNGQEPQAGLLMDGSGNLYGTTPDGATAGDGHGTVFELAKGSGTITTLASFIGTNGSFQDGSVVMDGSGNLYGTSFGGGAFGDGTVFELAHGSSTVTTLASFNGGDGADPYAGLLMDSSGDLYGTTYGGGASLHGTVFELPGAAAQTDQWTGANFAVDTNWSDGKNWSLGAPPTAGQTALFTKNASVKDFTSTVDAGFTRPVGGLDIKGTWGGTITVNSPLAVNGSFTLVSGTFGGSGAVTIAGDAMRWTGGQIDVGAGGFTNTGVLTADTTGGNLVVSGSGTLTNTGTITEAGTNALLLENAATLSNAGGATFDLAANGGVSQSGGGTFTNAGILEKTGGTGTSTIATTTLSNTGTVVVSLGTLDISAAVTQVSGKILTAGTWTVTGSATVHATLDITSAGSFTVLGSAAKVTLNGLNTTFSNLSGLATIAKGGSFSLLGGQAFTTTGALTNKGSLTLSPGSLLTVNGNFTQTSAGTLTIELGGTATSPTVGQLVSSTGTVALAGNLHVTSTVVPAVGSSFEVLDNEGSATISGTFTGLPEGATFTVQKGTKTMTFQITYAGTDTDGKQNVILKRTA